MKIGIIRCRATENYCPGTTDFKSLKIKNELELVSFVSCGGCPGKEAVLRAKELVRRGAECIAFASCIKKGVPIGFPCPNPDHMIEAVRKAVGSQVKILETTH